MSAFRFSTSLRVRLPETDAFGVVFHGYYYTYFDVARMDYLRKLGLSGMALPVNLIVHASADFKSPARFDDELVVFARIAEIGRTHFTFEFEVRHKKERRLVARGKTVHVTIGEKTWRPAPVPAKLRQAVRTFEGIG